MSPKKTTPTEKPAVPSTVPLAVPSATKSYQPIMLSLVVALILLGLGGGYYAYQLWQQRATDNTSEEVFDATNIDETVNIDPANAEDVNYSVTDVNVPGAVIGSVAWQDKKEVASLGLVSADKQYSEASEQNAKYYQVGTVKAGTMVGAKIILMTLKYDSPQGPDHYYFLQQGSVLTAMAKNSGILSADPTQDYLARTKFTVDAVNELPGLRFPDTLQGPKPRQKLVQDATVKDLFSAEGLTKVFTDPTYGAVYTKTSKLAANVDYNSNAAIDAFLASTAFTTRNGFYLKAPDGTVRVYKLAPDIVVSTDQYSLRGIPDITWTDATKNTDTYDFTFASGCGSINYINVVPPDDLSVKNDLQQTGLTAQQDPIYELKDTSARLLKDFYAATAITDENGGTMTQMNYTEFTASHPMIFWVDPFDRLIQLTNTKFAPLAECGKPVIYLYPRQTTDVDVSLYPQGGFTYTEPVYNNGWQVTAEPNGQLTERATGKTYPYLFWEGRGGIYTAPNKGSVVAQADIHEFLVTSLAKLGLNEKETADFIEFWEPRMQGSPYYQVSFLGNRAMDEIAPLSVSPKPDTVIRILMDFRPLQSFVNIEPQILRTPIRKGFTVVEWGGVLR